MNIEEFKKILPSLFVVNQWSVLDGVTIMIPCYESISYKFHTGDLSIVIQTQTIEQRKDGLFTVLLENVYVSGHSHIINDMELDDVFNAVKEFISSRRITHLDLQDADKICFLLLKHKMDRAKNAL